MSSILSDSAISNWSSTAKAAMGTTPAAAPSTSGSSGGAQTGYWTQGNVVNGTNVGGGVFVPSTQAQANSYNNSFFSGSPAPKISETINGGNLGGSNTISTPNYAPNSSSNAFVTSLVPTPQQTQDSTATPAASDAPATADQAWKKQFTDYYGNLVSKLGGEPQEFQDLQNKLQVPQITQNLADVRGLIAQRTAGYAAQWQLANTEHAALPYIAGEQTQIQRTQAVELGMLTAQEQALSGNLQAANDIVDRTIQHEFEPIKNMISASAQWFQMHQNDLTDSEKQQFQLNSSLTQMNYQNLLTVKNDAAKTAVLYGAPSSVMSQIASATSTTDVYNALGSLNSGSTNGTSSPLNGVVNGYDLSTYATDPQYGNKIAQASSSIGMITNTQQADQIIKGSAPSSPVTGDMIANAASTYGVDPNMIASIMKVESNFGTLGLGARTNNPGNVGNTDSGATTKYKTWQDGVNAVAQQLQNRKVSVQAALTNNTQRGTQQAIISTAPVLVQPAMRFTGSGTAYIDKGKLDSTSEVMARTYAARSGVPILDDAEVSAVQGLDTAMQNLNSMKANFDKLAPGWGVLGKVIFKLGAPGHKLLDTDYGSALSAYQSNRDNLFQQISALAGSHPRINTQELIAAANSLPKLTELSTDTLKDGKAKTDIVYNYLDNSMKAILPTYQPPNRTTPVSGPQNTKWQSNPDGTVTRVQ